MSLISDYKENRLIRFGKGDLLGLEYSMIIKIVILLGLLPQYKLEITYLMNDINLININDVKYFNLRD